MENEKIRLFELSGGWEPDFYRTKETPTNTPAIRIAACDESGNLYEAFYNAPESEPDDWRHWVKTKVDFKRPDAVRPRGERCAWSGDIFTVAGSLPFSWSDVLGSGVEIVRRELDRRSHPSQSEKTTYVIPYGLYPEDIVMAEYVSGSVLGEEIVHPVWAIPCRRTNLSEGDVNRPCYLVFFCPVLDILRDTLLDAYTFRQKVPWYAYPEDLAARKPPHHIDENSLITQELHASTIHRPGKIAFPPRGNPEKS